MKNVTVIMTAIAAAFCLIILGAYLYQTAPEKDTPNLPETELEAELEEGRERADPAGDKARPIPKLRRVAERGPAGAARGGGGRSHDLTSGDSEPERPQDSEPEHAET